MMTLWIEQCVSIGRAQAPSIISMLSIHEISPKSPFDRPFCCVQIFVTMIATATVHACLSYNLLLKLCITCSDKSDRANKFRANRIWSIPDCFQFPLCFYFREWIIELNQFQRWVEHYFSSAVSHTRPGIATLNISFAATAKSTRSRSYVTTHSSNLSGIETRPMQ